MHNEDFSLDGMRLGSIKIAYTRQNSPKYHRRFCPFAQRVWIALEEKKLNFSLVEVAIKVRDSFAFHQIFCQ